MNQITRRMAYLVVSANKFDYCDINGNFEFSHESGFTPLHFAVKSSALVSVQTLMARNADVNAKSVTGVTPVHLAFKNCIDADDIQIKREILDYISTFLHNRDSSFSDDVGITLLHLACASLNEEAILRSLRDGYDVNARILNTSSVLPGCTPLHVVMIACYDDELEKVLRIAEILLQHGGDVNLRNAELKTAVHIFYEWFSDDRFMKVLEARDLLNVNRTDASGLSHFHLACRLDRKTAVVKFLHSGVDMDHRVDDTGYNGLHFAMRYNCWNVVEVLLQRNADVNARTQDGSTPLHVAVKYLKIGDVTSIERILSTGRVDVNARNSQGELPIEVLVSSNVDNDESIVKVIQLILTNGGRVNVYHPTSGVGLLAKLLDSAISYDPRFKAVLEYARDLVEDDPDTGRNAIQNVVTGGVGSIEYHLILTIRDLLGRGLHLYHQDNGGKTALHTAADNKHVIGIKALLQCGADINTVDRQGRVPLQLCYPDRIGHLRLEILLQANVVGNLPMIILQQEAFYGSNEYQGLQALGLHAHTLSFLGLPVHAKNRQLLQHFEHHSNPFTEFQLRQKLELQKFQRIRPLANYETTLHDFLRESFSAEYPLMPRNQREAIDSYMQTNACDKFKLLGCVIRLQYRNGVERMFKMNAAKRAVHLMAGRPMPDFVAENIVSRLTTIDFRSFVGTVER